MNRPPGHISDLISDLRRWHTRRLAKGLPSRPMEMAIAYLEEYRDLANARDRLLTCAARTGDAVRLRVKAEYGIGLSCNELPFVECAQDFEIAVNQFADKLDARLAKVKR